MVAQNLILAWGQRQAERCEFEASLGYILIFQDSQPEIYSEILVSNTSIIQTPPSSSKKTSRTRLRERTERTVEENEKNPKDTFRRQVASEAQGWTGD